MAITRSSLKATLLNPKDTCTMLDVSPFLVSGDTANDEGHIRTLAHNRTGANSYHHISWA